MYVEDNIMPLSINIIPVSQMACYINQWTQIGAHLQTQPEQQQILNVFICQCQGRMQVFLNHCDLTTLSLSVAHTHCKVWPLSSYIGNHVLSFQFIQVNNKNAEHTLTVQAYYSLSIIVLTTRWILYEEHASVMYLYLLPSSLTLVPLTTSWRLCADLLI